jgi:hypothetical protein
MFVLSIVHLDFIKMEKGVVDAAIYARIVLPKLSALIVFNRIY